MNPPISFDTEKLYIFFVCVLISAINELIDYIIYRCFFKKWPKIKINSISAGIVIGDKTGDISEPSKTIPEVPLSCTNPKKMPVFIKRSFSLSALDITSPDFISLHQFKIFELHKKYMKIFQNDKLPEKKEISNEYSYSLTRKIHKYVQTETFLQNKNGRLETQNILPFKYINSAGLSTYLIIQSLEEMVTSALCKPYSKSDKSCMTLSQGESFHLESQRNSVLVDSSSDCTLSSDSTIVEYKVASNKIDFRGSSPFKRSKAFRKIYPPSYDSESSGNVSVTVKESPKDTVFANLWVGADDLSIKRGDPCKHLRPKMDVVHINNANMLHWDDMGEFEMFNNDFHENFQEERQGCFSSTLSRLKNFFCCRCCCKKNGYYSYGE